MERTTLPPGTYWCRTLGRFVPPSDPQYDREKFEEMTLGPMERGLFSDDDSEQFAAA